MAIVAAHSIAEYLADHPDVIVEQFAKESGVTPHAVVQALPATLRRFVDGARFVEAMQDIATWGDITLIVHTEDGIMEFGGPIPAGQVSRGYYNVPGSRGFHGHLRHDRCAGIAFVERPFMGRASASILFFNADGAIMFKVFVGRDENRNLKPDQLEAFRALGLRLEN
jgi:putative heme utilization carrier protein HutX